MNIFSRRKRLLNPRLRLGRPTASNRNRLSRILRRNRAGASGMPKMSSRRQFHRALRRHPAWPAVMEQAAARARAQENLRRNSTGVMGMRKVSHRKRLRRIFNRKRTSFLVVEQTSGRKQLQRALRRNRAGVVAMGETSGRAQFRRAIRRNRAGVIALVAVGAMLALLTGISLAQGLWHLDFPSTESQFRPPAARFGAATAFDEANGEMLIFGGFSPNAGSLASAAQSQIGPQNRGDTWAYKVANGKWFDRTQSALNPPSPRGFASAAYDGARRNVVLFGGAPYRTHNVSDETWTWDGKDWTLQNPPEPRPAPRQNASMVYDAHRKVVVMFGGRGAAAKLMQDTWTWDGSVWKIMSSAGAPTPRHSAAMAYDVCRAEAVMFGGVGDGFNNFAPQPGETWIWDGAKWTPGLIDNQAPLVSPPRRIGASMAYSPVSGRVLLYGGLYTTDVGFPMAATDTDVWRWDGASATGWEKMNSEASTAAGEFSPLLLRAWIGASPPPRAYASFVSSGARRFDLYGGTPSPETIIHSVTNVVPHAAFGDHFEFSEPGALNTDNPAPTAGSGDGVTPLTRRCNNPVPVPPDAPSGGQSGTEVPKEAAQVVEGMREFGRLPVLTGTPWPAATRNTHVDFGSSATPNPNYTPAPDCPTRNESFGDRKDNVETGSNTHLATDPKRNRVYQFFICDPNRGSNAQGQALPPVYKLLIGAYDGKTMKPLGSVVTPVRAETSNLSGSSLIFKNLLMHDADRERFLFRSSYWNGSANVNELAVIQQDLIEKGVDPLVKKIPITGGVASMSFFNHPKTGRAKLLINRGGTALSQVDLETNSIDWNATATGCISMGSAEDSLSIRMTPMRSGNRVYNACQINGEPRSGRYGVVRITITENADGTESAGTVELFAGPFNVTENWADPQTERMLLRTVTYGGRALWVFDGKASRYIGRAGLSTHPLGESAESGFDQEIGRFYYHLPDDQGWVAGEKYKVQGGLLVVDTRLTPVPQALNFTQFSANPGSPVAALPSGPGLPRRVFIRRHGGPMNKYPDGETVKMANEMHYTVLADEVPVSEQAEIAQLDALTIPVPEGAGRTEVSFDAEGSGYGIRLRSVGGIWSALRPPAQMYQSGSSGETVESAIFGLKAGIPTCVFPDRELVAGWVSQARLSDLDAAARGTGLEVDSNSKTDLQGPFSRCNPSAGPSNLPGTGKPVYDLLWPLQQLALFQANTAVGPNLAWGRHFKETECVGDSSQTNEAKLGDTTVAPSALVPPEVAVPSSIPTGTVTAPTGGKVPIGGITASATCNQKTGSVQAISRGALGGSAASDAFSVGEGYSNVVVAREPIRGVVVTSTAVATGIKLPSITIGYVTTTAVAWSNGRPGEGRASFSRTICNVNPPLPVNPAEATKDDRAPNTGCLSKDQQKKMADDFNTRMGVNGKMILPTPDPDLFKGSPGGYIAGVIKPVADALEDQLFVKDFQRELPGLVIEFYKDSQGQGPARQILQLAAVKAVTGFGVQCNAELVYSPSTKNCVALTFEDDPTEFEEEEELSSTDDTEFESDGGWTPVEATGPSEPLALGRRLGQFIQTLPVIRLLPLRQIGEALLAGAVWYLLGLPLFLTSRRFALNLARRS